MTDHKGSLFSCGVFGQHNEVALILAVVIIDDNHHFASSEAIKGS
jgi:hypothetical protein